MPHTLIIVVEIVPFREDSARVKRDFISDVPPIPKSHIKILNGPLRFIKEDVCQSPHVDKDLPVEKRFEAIIESDNISFFPEENTITVVIYDWTSFNLNGKVKVSKILEEYTKSGWEIIK